MEVLSVLKICSLLATGSLLLTTLEFLSLRKEFADHGAFGYKMHAVAAAGKPFHRLRMFLNRPKNFVYGVLGTRLLCAVLNAVLLAVFWELNPIVLVLLCLSTWVANVRCQIGLNGSDAVAFMVISAIAIASLFPEGDPVQVAALLFIAGQILLTYLAAGIFKLKSPTWRSGQALVKILSIETYGASWASAFLRKFPILSKISNWGVIFFECAFILVLFLPPPYVVAALALGFLFHLSTAVVMGINGFAWAFLSGYPAIYWASGFVSEVLEKVN